MWDTNQGVNINILRTLPVAITTVVQNRSNSCVDIFTKYQKLTVTLIGSNVNLTVSLKAKPV